MSVTTVNMWQFVLGTIFKGFKWAWEQVLYTKIYGVPLIGFALAIIMATLVMRLIIAPLTKGADIGFSNNLGRLHGHASDYKKPSVKKKNVPKEWKVKDDWGW